MKTTPAYNILNRHLCRFTNTFSLQSTFFAGGYAKLRLTSMKTPTPMTFCCTQT